MAAMSLVSILLPRWPCR